MFERLLSYFPRFFNKEPKAIPVIVITGAGEARVSSEVLAIGGSSISLSGISLAELVAAINGIAGYSATLSDSTYGSLQAWGLLPGIQDISLDQTLKMATSVFYMEMQLYARLLQQQLDQILDTHKQMHYNTATGIWLDTWGGKSVGYFGIERFSDETDEVYLPRMINQMLRPNQNNKALEQMIWDALGMHIEIMDAVPYADQLPPELVATAPGKFILNMAVPGDPAEATLLIERVKALVNKLKAAGTEFIEAALQRLQAINESVTVEEIVECTIIATVEEELVPGPVRYGEGWVYGTPGLVYGDNDPILEQVVVSKIYISTGIVEELFIGGGSYLPPLTVSAEPPGGSY